MKKSEKEHLGVIVDLLDQLLYELMYYNDFYGKFLDEYKQIREIYKTLSSIYFFEMGGKNDYQSR